MDAATEKPADGVVVDEESSIGDMGMSMGTGRVGVTGTESNIGGSSTSIDSNTGAGTCGPRSSWPSFWMASSALLSIALFLLLAFDWNRLNCADAACLLKSVSQSSSSLVGSCADALLSLPFLLMTAPPGSPTPASLCRKAAGRKSLSHTDEDEDEDEGSLTDDNESRDELESAVNSYTETELNARALGQQRLSK